MLHIHHAEDPRSPGKIYADACWAANPRLSPTWWSEVDGHTVGRFALDWRTGVHQVHHLAGGCNLILASPATWAATHAALSTTQAPESYVTLLVLSDPAALTAVPPPFGVLWQPTGAESPEQRVQALQRLEENVKSGTLGSYGIYLTDLITHPLHLWLEDAAEAANHAYGRRKRPSLRLLMVDMDLLDLTPLNAAVTLHKTESVSTLELAARLGLSVILHPPVLPDENAAIPPMQAMAALTHVAEAEQALNQSLGGWPQRGGQPLFSVLAHLAQGQSPWPTPAHWTAWRNHIVPELQSQWQTLATPALQPFLAHYDKALNALQPHGTALAAAAAQPLHRHLLASLKNRLTEPWNQTDDPLTLTTALLASMPAVAALALAQPFETAAIQRRGILPDIGAVFLQAPDA